MNLRASLPTSAPFPAPDATEELALRAKIIPLDVYLDRIPPDVLELYRGWVEHGRRDECKGPEAWIPIGCIGPILIFAHHTQQMDFNAFPTWAVGRVKISAEKYHELAASFH